LNRCGIFVVGEFMLKDYSCPLFWVFSWQSKADEQRIWRVSKNQDIMELRDRLTELKRKTAIGRSISSALVDSVSSYWWVSDAELCLLFSQRGPKSSSHRVISRHKQHRWIWLVSRYIYVYFSVYLKQLKTHISYWILTLCMLASCCQLKKRRADAVTMHTNAMKVTQMTLVSRYAPSFHTWSVHLASLAYYLSCVMSMFIIPAELKYFVLCWQMATTSECLKMQSKYVKQLCRLFPMRRVSFYTYICFWDPWLAISPGKIHFWSHSEHIVFCSYVIMLFPLHSPLCVLYFITWNEAYLMNTFWYSIIWSGLFNYSLMLT